MRWLLSFLIFSILFSSHLFAQTFWGSKNSQPFKTPSHKLKPGQFIWNDKGYSEGLITAQISLSEQRVYLYSNGDLFAVSTISTGRGKQSTPTGIFTVLGKDKFYRSKKYDNAPMPYTHWLTSQGIAMHAGNLPGYPASHGCIRLPTRFAHLLFQVSSIGMPVVITRQPLPKINLSKIKTDD